MTDRLTDEELLAACARADIPIDEDGDVKVEWVWFGAHGVDWVHLPLDCPALPAYVASRLVAMVRERKLHGQMAPKTWGASGGYEGVEEGAVADDVTRIRAAMEVLGDD